MTIFDCLLISLFITNAFLSWNNYGIGASLGWLAAASAMLGQSS